MSIDKAKSRIIAEKLFRYCHDMDRNSAIAFIELELIQVSAAGWNEGMEDAKLTLKEYNKYKEKLS